jgi:IMP cyclohydrolase
VLIKYFTAFSATELGIFAQDTIPVVELGNSRWTKYIYRIYSGPNANETLCKALCAFDNQNPDGNVCQFTAVSDMGTCYLGTFSKESTVLSITPMISEIFLKTGWYRE